MGKTLDQKTLIAIGRIRLSKNASLLNFIWHTFKANFQSKRAKGCLFSSVTREDINTFWSMSVWESTGEMMHYRNSGSHRAAMKKTAKFVEGVDFVSWEAESIPDWSTAMQCLKQKVEKRTSNNSIHPEN